jgi:high-affinity nickel-transport protein
MSEILASIHVSPVGAALLASAFVLGLRHGVDWDHIAAIADITGTQDSLRTSLWYSTLYAVGHASVVLAIGGALILADLQIPPGVESVMGRVVGATLIVLGIWVVVALVRHGEEFRLRSRWMLVFAGLRSMGRRVRGAEPVASSGGSFVDYGATTSVGVGMLHGIGAETPTQVVIFLGAARVGGQSLGMAVLGVFVLGLVTANTLIAVAASLGFLSATRSAWVYRATGAVVAAFSLILGTVFLLGDGSTLPALLS